MKKKLKTIGYILFFTYCQFIIGLCGYLVHYTITATDPDAQLYFGARIGLATGPFIIASLLAAMCAAQFMPKIGPRESIRALTSKVRNYFSPN